MRPAMILRVVVFALAAFVLNFPVIATAVTALKSGAEIVRNPGLTVADPTLENFAAVFAGTGQLDIWGYLTNSLVAAMIGTLLPMALCFPAAWAMARRDVGLGVLFPVAVNLRALPLIIFAIPIYLMYQVLGLLDTRLGLGLILTVVNVPIALLILVNTIHALPVELDEAAYMDGARTFTLLRRVVLPLSRPAFATIFVFGFVTAWNEFLFGLMLTTKEAVPVTVGASFFFATAGGGVQWGVAAAVILVAAAPPMLLGLFAYRYIGASMAAGAIKG